MIYDSDYYKRYYGDACEESPDCGGVPSPVTVVRPGAGSQGKYFLRIFLFERGSGFEQPHQSERMERVARGKDFPLYRNCGRSERALWVDRASAWTVVPFRCHALSLSIWAAAIGLGRQCDTFRPCARRCVS